MSDGVDAVFSALSDPTRRQVMEYIASHGSASAGEVAEQLPVTRQAVVKHLSALDQAGLVSGSRDGRQKRYRLTPQPMGEALSWMAQVGGEWDERLNALRKLLT